MPKVKIKIGTRVEGGQSVSADFNLMNNLLIGCSNTHVIDRQFKFIIDQLITGNTVKEVRLVLIGKDLPCFSEYDKSEYLFVPIVKNATDLAEALVCLENEKNKRIKILAENDNSKNITEFCQSELDELPKIIILINGLEDFINIDNSKSIQGALKKLFGQSIFGLHMILASSQPDNQVLVPIINVNFPARLCFKVNTALESRIILDMPGAEKLAQDNEAYYYNQFIGERDMYKIVV